ncbi:MAG: hypothetical protein A2Z18_11020 [Armatimonadetes bacterium RBG_16_58_9]|nr:MAG: hypothetical protein A2Z18_11020 [Armatimonadetes bacterium RBG_16_58_9]
MTVEEKIQAILVANAALIALVPAARIRVPGSWQNLTAPYIVHFPVARSPFFIHGGTPSLRTWDVYQLSIFSSTYSAGRSILNAAITALDGVHSGVHAFRKTIRHIREEMTDLEHFIVEFSVAE